MNYQIFRILEHEEVDRIGSDLAQRAFVDGKLTAQGPARAVKHNLQLDRTGPELSEIDRIVVKALQRHADFHSFAIPKRIMLPIFSRYEPGMEYGSHIDSAIMGGVDGERVRSDFAVTIFLSPPASYDGGELVIELPIGEEEIKLDAGEAVVYSASAVHRVSPVTRGVRLAAVIWVQSTVRNEQLRSILYDLGRALKHAEAGGDRDLTLQLTKSYHNLLRYAAEP
jgi:PKHD-type hydroxylase